MLAVSSYPKHHIDAARTDIAATLAAFDALPAGAARDALAPVLFNNMVLALDARFLHRVRNKEGKDGNPLNEVRLLCEALTEHGAVLADPPKTMKYKSEVAVLGLAPGDAIVLSRDDFAALSDAFFTELAARYS
jgi:hypothetical protein